MDHDILMNAALELAKSAYKRGEVPVGCVVADSTGSIIGRGSNCRESEKNACSHAELLAISEACAAMGDWRLYGCAIYVTLEPCPMCAGAIINARVPVLVFGAKNAETGSCGSVINLFEESYGHHPAIYAGVLERECSALLSEFFRSRRISATDSI